MATEKPLTPAELDKKLHDDGVALAEMPGDTPLRIKKGERLVIQGKVFDAGASLTRRDLGIFAKDFAHVVEPGPAAPVNVPVPEAKAG